MGTQERLAVLVCVVALLLGGAAGQGAPLVATITPDFAHDENSQGVTVQNVTILLHPGSPQLTMWSEVNSSCTSAPGVSYTCSPMHWIVAALRDVYEVAGGLAVAERRGSAVLDLSSAKWSTHNLQLGQPAVPTWQASLFMPYKQPLPACPGATAAPANQPPAGAGATLLVDLFSATTNVTMFKTPQEMLAGNVKLSVRVVRWPFCSPSNQLILDWGFLPANASQSAAAGDSVVVREGAAIAADMAAEAALLTGQADPASVPVNDTSASAAAAAALDQLVLSGDTAATGGSVAALFAAASGTQRRRSLLQHQQQLGGGGLDGLEGGLESGWELEAGQGEGLKLGMEIELGSRRHLLKGGKGGGGGGGSKGSSGGSSKPSSSSGSSSSGGSSSSSGGSSYRAPSVVSAPTRPSTKSPTSAVWFNKPPKYTSYFPNGGYSRPRYPTPLAALTSLPFSAAQRPFLANRFYYQRPVYGFGRRPSLFYSTFLFFPIWAYSSHGTYYAPMLDMQRTTLINNNTEVNVTTQVRPNEAGGVTAVLVTLPYFDDEALYDPVLAITDSDIAVTNGIQAAIQQVMAYDDVDAASPSSSAPSRTTTLLGLLGAAAAAVALL